MMHITTFTSLCLLPVVALAFLGTRSMPALSRTSRTIFQATNYNSLESSSTVLSGLNVAIVGAGPAGLLLAHRLLKSGAKCTLFESRSDPRIATNLEGRAYALGLGVRGRTAIRTVDETLWQSIKKRGYESERFELHLSKKIKFRLRDSPKPSASGKDVVEPSLLLYQSDLCSSFIDELESRYSKDVLEIVFNAKTDRVDFDNRKVIVQDGDKTSYGRFDLVAGCDGVNSNVRKSVEALFPKFKSTMKMLPGVYKVTRVPIKPPKVDPTSVHLIVGSGTSTTAFVEPTAGGQCCVLFAGKSQQVERNDSYVIASMDGLMSVNASQYAIDLELTAQDIAQRYPLLEGLNFTDIASQLYSQKAGLVSSIKCNVYHAGDLVALVGDAAHATGGVTGQGCNSALMDSVALANELEASFTDSTLPTKESKIKSALLKYSQKQVLEGLALYDLAFGSEGKLGFRKSIKARFRSLVDTVFGGRFGIGKPLLQTQLTTSLASFSSIRRARADFYAETFPDEESFKNTIAQLSSE